MSLNLKSHLVCTWREAFLLVSMLPWQRQVVIHFLSQPTSDWYNRGFLDFMLQEISIL